nr:MAG TPA: hypothetical protein [Bacteriophage sp.]
MFLLIFQFSFLLFLLAFLLNEYFPILLLN